MSEEFNTDQDKTEEPSLSKIEKVRQRGEVASSKELSSIFILSACILSLFLGSLYIYETLENFVDWIYSLDVEKVFEPRELKSLIYKSILVGFKCFAPIGLVSLIAGIIINVAQIGFIFSVESLGVKWGRINPISGIKKMCSFRLLFDAIKGAFKFIFILGIVYFFISYDIENYNNFFHVEFVRGLFETRWILSKLSFSILLGLSVIAMGDFAYQKISYRKKIMMTKEELKKENKEKEGNPEVKQRIRSIQKSLAQKRMMNEIKNADVVITNPTHVSVALKYDREKMSAPELIAKGADHLALKIKKIAQENSIPVVENISLARTMYKTMKIGQGIPYNLYHSVAEVLAYVYKFKRKERALENGW